jgi:hypothetical protein
MPGGRRKPTAKRTSRRTAGSRPRSRVSRGRQVASRHPHARALVALAELAKRQGLRWYVFGAQAVNLHGYPRATADLDVTVQLDGDAATFVRALSKAGFEPRFADAAFIAAARVIPVEHRASRLPIDIVLAGPGLEQQFLDEVVYVSLDGHEIPILSIENLIVTKLIAGRSKDLDDVRELVARSAATIDRRKVDAMLALVEQALGVSDLVEVFRRIR